MLTLVFTSGRCVRFAGRIRDTAGSCLVSAQVSRRAPNSSKTESRDTQVDLWATFNHITDLFISIVKKTLIISQLINISKLPITSCTVHVRAGLYTHILN